MTTPATTFQMLVRLSRRESIMLAPANGRQPGGEPKVRQLDFIAYATDGAPILAKDVQRQPGFQIWLSHSLRQLAASDVDALAEQAKWFLQYVGSHSIRMELQALPVVHSCCEVLRPQEGAQLAAVRPGGGLRVVGEGGEVEVRPRASEGPSEANGCLQGEKDGQGGQGDRHEWQDVVDYLADKQAEDTLEDGEPE